MLHGELTFCNGYTIRNCHLDSNLVKNIDKRCKSYVYMWVHHGIVFYIGKGRGYRAISHLGDLLSRVLDYSWELIIVAENLSDIQARVLEAKLLQIAKETRGFSASGSYDWDGVSLINKRVERTYKGIVFAEVFEQYLNLNDRNWKKLKWAISKH